MKLCLEIILSFMDVDILVIIYHKKLLLYQMGEWWVRELWIEREKKERER